MNEYKKYIFFKNNLSTKKYFTYKKRQCINKLLKYVIYNIGSTLSNILLIFGKMFIFEERDIAFIHKTLIDIIYSRGDYASLKCNTELKEYYASIINQ